MKFDQKWGTSIALGVTEILESTLCGCLHTNLTN